MYNELFRKYFRFCGFIVVGMGVIVLMIGMTAIMVSYGENLQYLVYLGIPFIIVGIVIVVVTGMLKPGYKTRSQKKLEKSKKKNIA